MKYLLIPILNTLLLTTPVYAVEKASEARLNEVARRGVHVMPFNLEQTTHIFSKSPSGGIQQVIAKEATNTQQINLIREHLTKISTQFKHRNFSDPEKIHGKNMPGLAALQAATSTDISMVYQKLPNGAEITYSTQLPELITTIHQWFDAQLSDHARHSISGHAHHKMYHNP